MTRERLRMVDRAEAAVRAEGIRIFRVRHQELAGGGALARVEVAADEWSVLNDPSARARVVAAAKEAGYAFVTVDAEPFRSGRLNEAAGLVRLAVGEQ